MIIIVLSMYTLSFVKKSKSINRIFLINLLVKLEFDYSTSKVLKRVETYVEYAIIREVESIINNSCSIGEYSVNQKHWSESAVGYQIYPRSFKDSNGDGIGDLRGVIEKLDYLNELGIDVIWICPFYKSPNADHGYDISDYHDIMDEFGTMEDCDQLLREVHKRGMRLIIDLVINHTSDEHPWFIESKSDVKSEKRDWYIWKQGKNGVEPNNWESIFKGSAWQLCENSGEHYLHVFDKKQPDLNWENKEVREALYEMVNWWLDKGIDGFRVDAISHIKKDLSFSDMDNPENLDYVPCFPKMMNVDGIDPFLKELKERTFDRYDIMTVGEANGVKVEDAHKWAGKEDGYFNMIFQFNHLKLWNREKNTLDLVALKKTLTNWQETLHGKGWNALYIENHDLPRVVSKWGDEKNYWKESAKTLGLMYFMQEGTPFIYQGQEIGMTNVTVDEVEEYQEGPTIITYYENLKKGMTKEEALEISYRMSRANSRTPMQWDSSKNAGFTLGNPWMKVNENYTEISVENQEKDPDSILSFYREMIKIRKSETDLVYAPLKLLVEADEQVYGYKRIGVQQEYLVVCNMSNEDAIFEYDDEIKGDLMIATHKNNEIEGKTIKLQPFEGRMYRLQ